MVDLLTYPRPGYNGNWQDFIPQVTRSPLGNVVPLWNCYNDDEAPVYNVTGGVYIDTFWKSVPQNLVGCKSIDVRVWTSEVIDMYLQIISWDGSTYYSSSWLPWTDFKDEPATAFANNMPYWDDYCTLYSINDPETWWIYPIGPGYSTVSFSLVYDVDIYGVSRYGYFPMPQSVMQNCWYVILFMGVDHYYTPWSFSVPYIVGARCDAQIF